MKKLMLILCAITLVGFKTAAADEASCNVLEIEANSKDGGIDKSLKQIEDKLKKPPFSSWKSFKLIKKHTPKLVLMHAKTVSLAKGGKLSMLYRDRVDTKGKKTRLRLSFTIDDSEGSRQSDVTIKLDSGTYYMSGGRPLKNGGTYILAAACSVK